VGLSNSGRAKERGKKERESWFIIGHISIQLLQIVMGIAGLPELMNDNQQQMPLPSTLGLSHLHRTEPQSQPYAQSCRQTTIWAPLSLQCFVLQSQAPICPPFRPSGPFHGNFIISGLALLGSCSHCNSKRICFPFTVTSRRPTASAQVQGPPWTAMSWALA